MDGPLFRYKLINFFIFKDDWSDYYADYSSEEVENSSNSPISITGGSVLNNGVLVHINGLPTNAQADILANTASNGPAISNGAHVLINSGVGQPNGALPTVPIVPGNGVPANGQNGMVPSNGMSINGVPSNGIAPNGMPSNGMLPSGMTPNGMSPNGIPSNGMLLNGMSPSGMAPNSIPSNGMLLNGMSPNGMAPNGIASNGMTANGMPSNGMPPNSMAPNGMPSNGM